MTSEREKSSKKEKELWSSLIMQVKDLNLATRLYRDLQIENLNPWLDKECILPGQDWQNEITKAY